MRWRARARSGLVALIVSASFATLTTLAAAASAAPINGCAATLTWTGSRT
jgi:hypothetical protein